MALGTYYLTSIDAKIPARSAVFSDEAEALTAYENDAIALRQEIRVRIDGEIVTTSVGRVIFNGILPASLRFHNEEVEKKAIRRLVNTSLLHEPEEVTVRLIDDIKSLGFEYSTRSGVSVSIFDNVVSPKREEVLKEADEKAHEISENFRRGLITRREKSTLIQGVWTNATHELDELTWEELDDDNDVKVIVAAGASRASREQVKQLGGMKGLVYDVTGNIAELPIKSNFRKGLSGIEYFTGARAARKSLADTALKTADSGYLTRRLVDVAQELVIREEDCGTKEGFVLQRKQKIALSSFGDRLFGRIVSDTVKDGKKILARKGTLLSKDIADTIDASGVEEVAVRSPLTCEAPVGICQKCYGLDLGDRKLVNMGIPVGVIAAQSIGEPGTQLTLRTFHTGGIVGKDITQGLPRITELFEARTPKFKAVMSEIPGTVSFREEDGEQVLVVTALDKKADPQEVVYKTPKALDVIVQEGDVVAAGASLTEGYLDPKVLLSDIGVAETKRYLLDEVQHVYSSQGVAVNDKHVEVIVRQMFSKLLVDDPGDSTYFPGDVVAIADLRKVNAELKKAGKTLATVSPTLLGITKAALRTESFLAAASFQETSRVLTEAAMSGKVDRLTGLKENVIIGRRIPVGIRVEDDFEEEEAEAVEE